MKPQISIIIPTYNGAHKIGNILQAIASQVWEVPEIHYEILIIIDGSTDHTLEILQKQSWIDRPLQIIQQANSGRSLTRNCGAQKAQGELLVFFDDDMRPTPECLGLHWLHYQQYPDSLLVGSQLEDYEVLKTDIQRFKAHLSRTWIAPLDKMKDSFSKENLFLTAANFSIPQRLFWDLGGFDEQLRDAEDYDLGVRALEKGIAIYFNAEVLAWHDDFITCKSYIRRGREYQKAHQTLLRLKPELYHKYPIEAYSKVKGFKKTVYHFFAQPIWVKIIDSSPILMILPRKLRYKIYDLVITGLVAHFPETEI